METRFGRALVLALLLGGLVAEAPSQDGPKHRISICEVDGQAKFFDASTGAEFVPRGFNYTRLKRLRKHSDRTFMSYHSTFNRGAYDRASAQKALAAMAREKYNTVRVFLNHATEGGIADPGQPLSRKYIDNFVDFVRLAKDNDIVVLPTIDGLPIPEPTGVNRSLWCPDFQCTAAHVLTEEGVKANTEFFTAFVRKLKKANAPFDAILGYELRNELTFEPDLPPLTLTRGSVKTANGKTYLLSDPRQKQLMLEEGLVFWLNQTREAIRAEDPEALVGVGLVPPQEPHPIRAGDHRLSITRPVIEKSELDFIDVHIYPETNRFGMKAFAENFGFSHTTDKPILLGEFGALVTMYTSVEVATRAMVEWQQASVEFGIDGWLLWAWDADLTKETWNAVDGGGMMGRALAPASRAIARDPLAAGVMPDRPTLTARASATQKSTPPELAIDGTLAHWGAGAFAPQWIEVRLNPPGRLSAIQLVVSQSPAGHTVHELWLQRGGGPFVKVHNFDGETKDLDRLTYSLGAESEAVEAIRIVTVKSPSWVGWREIELIPRSAE